MANGRNRISEDDFINLVSDQFPQIIGQVEQGASQVFGKPGLTPEEEDRLSRLDQRATRLQPLDIEGPRGSSRIRGNPFSTDVNPLVRGGQSIVEGIINKVRRGRLEGDPQQVKKSKQKIESAQEELKQLEKASLQDSTMMGPGASDELTDAVSGDKKQRMEQLRRQIEEETQRVREAEGVTAPRQRLLEKKEEGQQAEQDIRDLVANISPRVAQSMFDREATREKQELAHDLSLEEIEKRHAATMAEISERNKGKKGLSASVLETLQDSVGAVQEKMTGEIDSLETEKAFLNNALKDEEVEEIVKKRLPEGTSIQDRLDEVEKEVNTKRARLQRSVKQMITVAAERNNLDKARTARLLGYEPDELDFDTGEEAAGEEEEIDGPDLSEDDQEETQEPITRSREEVEQWAQEHMGGDFEKAKQWLKENRNVVVE